MAWSDAARAAATEARKHHSKVQNRAYEKFKIASIKRAPSDIRKQYFGAKPFAQKQFAGLGTSKYREGIIKSMSSPSYRKHLADIVRAERKRVGGHLGVSASDISVSTMIRNMMRKAK